MFNKLILLFLLISIGCQNPVPIKETVQIHSMVSLVVLDEVFSHHNETFLICEDFDSQIKKVFVVNVDKKYFSVGDTYTILFHGNGEINKIFLGETSSDFSDLDIVYDN
jgi:uncharacterized protein YxjI